MNELPDKIQRIDVLRVERGKRKLCDCWEPSYEIDSENRIVICKTCGAIVDPFEALLKIARHYDRLNEETAALLEQRREILNYKPHLLLLREFAEHYGNGRGRNSMVPCCPHCGKPFDLPITNWCNRAFLNPKEGDKP
jgi:hypothetical protein